MMAFPEYVEDALNRLGEVGGVDRLREAIARLREQTFEGLRIAALQMAHLSVVGPSRTPEQRAVAADIEARIADLTLGHDRVAIAERTDRIVRVQEILRNIALVVPETHRASLDEARELLRKVREDAPAVSGVTVAPAALEPNDPAVAHALINMAIEAKRRRWEEAAEELQEAAQSLARAHSNLKCSAEALAPTARPSDIRFAGEAAQALSSISLGSWHG